jgi:hypothetical protein
MDKRDDDAATNDPIDAAESTVQRAEGEEDPVRLEAISQLHDILELELDRPEDEVPADEPEPKPDDQS